MSEAKQNISQEIKNPKHKSRWGVRYFQFIIFFITCVIFYGMRTALSVAIISMTDETSSNKNVPTYPEWNNTDMVLSSFFWGYVIPQVGAGQLSEYFGPKWFLFGTMVIGSVFNIVIPPMADSLGETGVIVCRVLQGCCQGFLYPSVHNLISRWSPYSERARILNFVYGGSSLGIALSMVVTGLIADSQAGWPVAFYVYGGVGLGWSVVFALLAENSPDTHKNVSPEEKAYIQESNSVTDDISEKKKSPTPWASIVTSIPFWAALISGCSSCWGNFTLLTEIPSYLSSAMKFDMKQNSVLSAAPYVAMGLTGMALSPISDKLISNKILSITTTRKIFNSLATYGPALPLIGLAFIDTDQKEVAVVLLVLAVGLTGLGQSGYMVNVIDLAPNHAGTLFGMVNSTNNIFSILGPLTVGFLGSDKEDPILWRKVFLISAGFFIVCSTIFNIFATGEVQPWNSTPDERKKTNKQEEA